MNVNSMKKKRQAPKKRGFNASKHIIKSVKISAKLGIGQAVVGSLPTTAASPALNSSMGMMGVIPQVHSAKGILRSVEDLGK